MILKRNLFTILYSVLFVGFMGIGFAIMAGLLLTNDADNNYLNTCILALSLLIYLIAAFFLKEKRIMLAAEGKESLYIILETVLVLASAGGIIYLDLSKGTDRLIWIVLMLLSTYAAARLLGGRLCGILGLLLSFFYLVSVTDYTVIAQEYQDSLCFLIPFILFLLIVHTLTPRLADNGFIIVSSYLLLSVVFTFAIIMNPYVAILFIGCVLALIFGETKKKMVLSGTILAGIFFAVTMLFLVAAWFFLGDLILLPEWIADETLFSSASLEDLGMYLLDKYTGGMTEIYEPFGLGIFPVFFTFMGTAAGYYSIRKKASAVGPLCLSFVFLFVVYILYGEMDSHFYYMKFFLPVFAAYAFACSLLPDNWNVAFHGSGEEGIPEIPEYPEDIPEEEQPFDGMEQPDTGEEETVYELELEKDEKTEDRLAAEPLLKPVDEPPEVPVVQLEQVQIEPAQVMPEKRQTVVSDQNVQKEEESVDRPLTDIPEWKVSEGFLQSQSNETTVNTEPEKEKPKDTRRLQTPQLEPQLQSQPLPPIPPIPPVQMETPQDLLKSTVPPIPQPQEVMGKAETGLSPSEQGNDTLSVPNPGHMEENISSAGNLVINENNDDLLASYMEEDNMLSVPLSAQDGQNAEEDESKLTDLLNRLDISDNIRRMNESAQEDRADVIERDDEQIELASAIPTEDFEGLTDAYTAGDNDLTDISSLTGGTWQGEEPELQLEPDLSPDAGLKLEPELSSEPMLELESELSSEPMLEPEPELSSEPMLELEPELSSEPMLELEPELSSETGLELDSDLLSEPIPEPPMEEPDSEEDLNTLDLDSFTPSDTISENIFEEKIPEPVQPVISEYDKVPTINDLERKWRRLSGQDSHEMENGFAYSLEDIPGARILSDSVHTDENEQPEAEEYTAVGEIHEPEDQLMLDELSVVEEQSEPVKLPRSEELSKLENLHQLEDLPRVEKLLEPEKPPVEKTETKASVSPVSLVEEERPLPRAKEIHSEQIVKKTGKGKRSYHKITWSR